MGCVFGGGWTQVTPKIWIFSSKFLLLTCGNSILFLNEGKSALFLDGHVHLLRRQAGIRGNGTRTPPKTWFILLFFFFLTCLYSCDALVIGDFQFSYALYRGKIDLCIWPDQNWMLLGIWHILKGQFQQIFMLNILSVANWLEYPAKLSGNLFRVRIAQLASEF